MVRDDRLVLMCRRCGTWTAAPPSDRPLSAQLCPTCGAARTEMACTRCGHVWWPRTVGVPSRCPACKSQYWHRRRTRPIHGDRDRDGRREGR